MEAGSALDEKRSEKMRQGKEDRGRGEEGQGP